MSLTFDMCAVYKQHRMLALLEACSFYRVVDRGSPQRLQLARQRHGTASNHWCLNRFLALKSSNINLQVSQNLSIVSGPWHSSQAVAKADDEKWR
jgi:hypothetical protein